MLSTQEDAEDMFDVDDLVSFLYKHYQKAKYLVAH